MAIRRFLVQASWYYLLISTTAVIFLFVTTLNNVFDGRDLWKASWLNESNQVAALFWGIMLVDQLVGLFVIILLRRTANSFTRAYFAFLFSVHFILFVVPSLVSILIAILSSSNV